MSAQGRGAGGGGAHRRGEWRPLAIMIMALSGIRPSAYTNPPQDAAMYRYASAEESDQSSEPVFTAWEGRGARRQPLIPRPYVPLLGIDWPPLPPSLLDAALAARRQWGQRGQPVPRGKRSP